MILLFLWQIQKFKGKSLLSFQKKKEPFACMIFGKIYLASAINYAGKLICLEPCLHECYCTGLTGKSEYMHKSNCQMNEQIFLNERNRTLLFFFKMFYSNECLIQMILFHCNFSDWNITMMNIFSFTNTICS